MYRKISEEAYWKERNGKCSETIRQIDAGRGSYGYCGDSEARKGNQASGPTNRKQRRRHEMFVIHLVAPASDDLNDFVGNQVRESLGKWVTPSDPSTNHTIACGIQHNGSAQWFFRGGIFSEWKSNGSLLWIHGKRMFFPIGPGPEFSADDHPHSEAGSGKSILWSVIARNCTLVRPAYLFV